MLRRSCFVAFGFLAVVALSDFVSREVCCAADQTLPDAHTEKSSSKEAFLAAYLKIGQLFDSGQTVKQRERSIGEALDRFQTSGLRVVMPYVTSTSGTAYYPSRVMSERAYGQWDPLTYLIRAARERSLQVYPVICVLSCGHDKPAGILRAHPEWALRNPEGVAVGHLCPTNPQARAWVTSVVAEVVQRYEVEGILLDYLRYSNRPSRLDAASEKEFERLKGQRPSTPKAELLQQYREQALTTLTGDISRVARKLRPGLQIAIYSWGPHVARNHRVAQNWPAWSTAGYVDMVNISGYCYPDNYGDKYLEVFEKRIGDAVKLNRQVGGKAQITFCLGVATSHGKIRSATWVRDYLTRGAKQGVSGTAFFTWSTLRPFLDDVERERYIPRFVDQIRR